jgi:hypothetical protein
MTFNELVSAAEVLDPPHKLLLIQRLQATLPPSMALTRQAALAEIETLRAQGAFENVSSLMGKYAKADVQVSDDELREVLRQIGTAWESELDELG